jgi:hypothetical protein
MIISAVEIWHLQAQTFLQAQAGAIEQAGHEMMHAGKLCHTVWPLGAVEIVEAWELLLQYVAADVLSVPTSTVNCACLYCTCVQCNIHIAAGAIRQEGVLYRSRR